MVKLTENIHFKTLKNLKEWLNVNMDDFLKGGCEVCIGFAGDDYYVYQRGG